MLKLKKLLFGFVIAFSCVIFVNIQEVCAAECYVPVEVQNLVNYRYNEMVDLIKNKNIDFDVTLQSLQNTELGSPFLVLDENTSSQDEIYYFPIINGRGEVVLVMSVMGTDEGWRLAMDTEYVEVLESVDYTEKEEVILHKYDKGYMVENDIKRYWVSQKDKQIHVNRVGNSVYNQSQDYVKKQLKRLKKARTDLTTDDKNECCGAYSPSFSTSTSTAKIMKLHNKQSQGNYGLCWAATVATIVNYIYGKDYTAMEIADLNNVGYDEGGSLALMKNALSKCLVTYWYMKSGQLDFDTIKLNVKEKRPIAVRAEAEGKAPHAVTLYGYGGDFIYLWNSGNSKSQLIEYSEKGTVFPYANATYLWVDSLYGYE